MKHVLDRLRGDLRYGFRSLRTNPGYSAIVVLTVALGIGATCAVFSFVYAALLRPLPFAHAERLAFLSTGQLQSGVFKAGVSAAELREWAPRLQPFVQEFATVSGNRQSTWAFGDDSAQLADRSVSGNFFSMLGVKPFAGRVIGMDDAAEGQGDVAVLSYEFWQRHFGGDPRVLGQPIRKRGGDFAAYTVVGILPPSFQFDETTDVWTPDQPLPNNLANLRNIRRSRVVARLLPGVRPRQLQSAMDTLSGQLAQRYPATNRGWEIRVVPLREHFQADAHRAVMLLWAAASCLLLIACVNAASLVVSRSSMRTGEIGLRIALGSSRGQLVAQLLTESAILASLGGALGWGAAAVLLRLLGSWGPWLIPRGAMQDVQRLHPDVLEPGVILFTVLACGVTLLAFSLAPALRATQPRLYSTLQAVSGRSTRRLGFSQAMVTVEVAVVMVLLMSAGLLVRSFVSLTSIDPGFRTAKRLTFDVELPRQSASSPLNAEDRRALWRRRTQWFEELEARLRTIPGVVAAGSSDSLPLTDDGGGWGGMVAGKQLPPTTSLAEVSPGYFDSIGAPIVQGENFSAATYSMAGAKSLIVNQTMAGLLFPDGGAVGKRLNAPRCGVDQSRDVQPTECVIVGVARDTRFRLDSPPPPAFYYSLHQDVGDRLTYVLRTNLEPAALIPAVRTLVATMPPIASGKAYLFHLQAFDRLLADSVSAPRFRSWLTSFFTVLALILAAVGIYGVQAQAVSRSTREIGIRVALGAGPAALFRRILGEAAGWAMLGVGIGLGMGLAATRVISGFLFGVTTWDPVTFVAAATIVLGVAMAATCVPAFRALRVDPVLALRSE